MAKSVDTANNAVNPYVAAGVVDRTARSSDPADPLKKARDKIKNRVTS